MKLYMTALSTHCRPVMAFLAEESIAHEAVMLDLAKGESRTPDFLALNPSGAVPVLVDEGFVLTESSAILKYVAEKHGSKLYPTGLRERARVNERMDWFNTGFEHHVAYDLVYPQLLPHHKRSSDEVNAAVIAWGLEKAKGHYAVLEQMLGDAPWLAGASFTIADYFGASFASLTRTIGGDLRAYPRVAAWLDRVEARPSWAPASAAFTGLGQHLASVGAKLVTVRSA